MGFLEEMRLKSLVSSIAPFIGKEKTALDVGCGTGAFAKALAERFGMKVKGIDLRPPRKEIDFVLFDGKKIPFGDNSFELVFLVDVLHHVAGKADREKLIEECKRVSSKALIIKDHYYENRLQRYFLNAMDFTTNSFYSVHTPFGFISKQEWNEMKADWRIYWTSLLMPHVIVKIRKAK